jgi:hypothetical protein
VVNREELYRNWLDWVTTNLGRNEQSAVVAATAATDAAELGKGFNVAVMAATAAWKDAGNSTSTGMAEATPTEADAIDHTGTNRDAVCACAFGIAVWLWPIVTALLLIAGGTDNTGPVVGLGVVMLMSGMVAVPILFLLAIVCGHWASARIKRSGQQGQGYAIAGLVLAYAAVPAALLGFVALFFIETMASCYAVMC